MSEDYTKTLDQHLADQDARLTVVEARVEALQQVVSALQTPQPAPAAEDDGAAPVDQAHIPGVPVEATPDPVMGNTDPVEASEPSEPAVDPVPVLDPLGLPAIRITGATLSEPVFNGSLWGQQRWSCYATLGTARLDVTLCLDANGRQSAEFYLGFDPVNPRETVAYEVVINGAPRQIEQVKGTLWRWESTAREPEFSQLPHLVESGLILPHAPAGWGSYTSSTMVPSKGGAAEGAFSRTAAQLEPYANSSGGERSTIGLIDNRDAALVAGLCDPADWWASAKTRMETVGQFDGYWYMDRGFPLDPSDPQACWHRNYAATEGAAMRVKNAQQWDLAHPMNGLFLPALLVDDPYYLLLLQLNAVAAIGYGTAKLRPEGYRGVIFAEERGFWWGLRALFWAYEATPDDVDMVGGFLPKSYFAEGIEQTWDYLRERIGSDSIHGQARRFWGSCGTFDGGDNICISQFMVDYGNQVLLWMHRRGLVPADILEWKMRSISIRARLGGKYINGNDALDSGISLAVAGKDDAVLPYHDADSFHDWMTARRAEAGLDPIDRGVTPITFSGATHRDLHLFYGVLRLAAQAELKPDGIDPAMIADHMMNSFVDADGQPLVAPFKAGFFVRDAFG